MADLVDRDELVAVHWRSHVGAVAEGCSAQTLANWRVQPLQEAHCGVLQDCIIRCADSNLTLLDDIGVDAIDL